MNYEKACKILKLNNNFKIEHLKSNYRKYALIYHPDKNDNDKTTFYLIKDAYEYLLEYKIKYTDNINNIDNIDNIDNIANYHNSDNSNIILYEFLKYLNISIDINKLIEIINNFNENKITHIQTILSSIKYEYLIEIYCKHISQNESY